MEVDSHNNYMEMCFLHVFKGDMNCHFAYITEKKNMAYMNINTLFDINNICSYAIFSITANMDQNISLMKGASMS